MSSDRNPSINRAYPAHFSCMRMRANGVPVRALKVLPQPPSAPLWQWNRWQPALSKPCLTTSPWPQRGQSLAWSIDRTLRATAISPWRRAATWRTRASSSMHCSASTCSTADFSLLKRLSSTDRSCSRSSDYLPSDENTTGTFVRSTPKLNCGFNTTKLVSL